MAQESPKIATLTGPQQLALEALIAGKNSTKAASAAGVDRGTITRWRRYPGPFREALLEAYESIREQLIEDRVRDVELGRQCLRRAARKGDVQAAAILYRAEMVAALESTELDVGGESTASTT